MKILRWFESTWSQKKKWQYINKDFYQYKIYPVDTCGVTLFAPPYNSLSYLNDTSFAQTILLESEINLDYSIIPSLDSLLSIPIS